MAGVLEARRAAGTEMAVAVTVEGAWEGVMEVYEAEALTEA